MKHTTERIELVPIEVANLQRLAAFEPPDFGSIAVPQGSLPPRKVVERALSNLEAGIPAVWCLPYLIFPVTRETIFGSCGFKGAPQEGRVEISYGLASPYRRRGIGTAAIGQLLHIAAASEAVSEVTAHIVKRHAASERLVRRLGFAPRREFVDLDGADVVMWVWRKQARE